MLDSVHDRTKNKPGKFVGDSPGQVNLLQWKMTLLIDFDWVIMVASGCIT